MRSQLKVLKATLPVILMCIWFTNAHENVQRFQHYCMAHLNVLTDKFGLMSFNSLKVATTLHRMLMRTFNHLYATVRLNQT